MTQSTVLDRYGNNAALCCPHCYGTFVISEHVNKKSGRVCPHCERAKALVDIDGRFSFQVLEATPDANAKIRSILSKVRPLATEFYRLTGKPLGVTGEIAEFVAAEILGLELVPARTTGYDALRGSERIQIKGRAYTGRKAGQRMSRIKLDAPCDTVLLVLLDDATLDPHEIWEASYKQVSVVLSRPGSKARENGALGVQSFKTIAKCVWNRESGDKVKPTSSSTPPPRPVR